MNPSMNGGPVLPQLTPQTWRSGYQNAPFGYYFAVWRIFHQIRLNCGRSFANPFLNSVLSFLK
jgi:hypothetical protein